MPLSTSRGAPHDARPLRALLRRPLTVGLAALTAVALTTVGLAVVVLTVLGERVDRSNEMLSALQDGHIAMLNQETALRGFLVTRESRFLEPYVKGSADLAEADETLERLMADDPQLAEAFTELQAAEWRFLTEWARPVLRSQPAVGDMVALDELLKRDKARFDAYREVESAARVLVEEQRRNALAIQRAVVIAGAALSLAVTAAVAVAVRRANRKLAETLLGTAGVRIHRRRATLAGLGVAILGSLYMMLIVLVLSLPIGVAASIYLEEFAPRNRLTDLIEVNIANLAAVPSIVYGILGLAAFINFMGLPRSAPIVGGLVLTLMTLPTIIIATRAALKAVPPSIRDAALGVGASKMQTVFHHVLPLAMPGILTGTIIGLAHALGETAPLLLIGMVAFVKEYPSAPPEGLFDPASALPVQIYNWTRRADPAFFERASGAIIVLLVFLLAMNLLAIFLRRKFERRW